MRHSRAGPGPVMIGVASAPRRRRGAGAVHRPAAAPAGDQRRLAARAVVGRAVVSTTYLTPRLRSHRTYASEGRAGRRAPRSAGSRPAGTSHGPAGSRHAEVERGPVAGGVHRLDPVGGRQVTVEVGDRRLPVRLVRGGVVAPPARTWPPAAPRSRRSPGPSTISAGTSGRQFRSESTRTLRRGSPRNAGGRCSRRHRRRRRRRPGTRRRRPERLAQRAQLLRPATRKPPRARR